MNKAILIICVSILVSVPLGELWADCTYSSNIGGACYTWNPGVENNCGDGCTYTYDADTKTVNVTAKGNNAKINEGKLGISYYEGNQYPVPIDNIIVDGQFSSIGMHAFANGKARLSSKDGKLILPANGWNSFHDKTLVGDILVPTEISSIGAGSFSHLIIDGSLIIPDNIQTIGRSAFYDISLTAGSKIYCSVEDCAQKIIDSCEKATYPEDCRNKLEPILSNPDKFEQAPEGCSYWSADGCKKCSNANFKFDGEYCYRIRYTPAEAAEAAGEKNTIFLYYK